MHVSHRANYSPSYCHQPPLPSTTDVIGEKLRALYDDAAQPCPARIMELLRALGAETMDRALTQIPHLGTIN
jgi:hypothetical protein